MFQRKSRSELTASHKHVYRHRLPEPNFCGRCIVLAIFA